MQKSLSYSIPALKNRILLQIKSAVTTVQMSGCKVQSTHKTLLQNILVVHPDIIGLLYMYNFFTLAFSKKIVKK